MELTMRDLEIIEKYERRLFWGIGSEVYDDDVDFVKTLMWEITREEDDVYYHSFSRSRSGAEYFDEDVLEYILMLFRNEKKRYYSLCAN